ncbi:MAG: RhuM family protein [Candidatus Pacebacteria bacterium]|nr:RhuM family protein [Candidatus Paceibacterota bacterium]
MKKGNNIIIYQAESGEIRLKADFKKENIWANLDQIAFLFDRDKSVISRHISNIFKEGELEKKTVVAKNATTASDGKTYQVDYYNLDAIISVGYRINSAQATQFRIWATKTLREHITKGYTINKLQLKNNYEQFLKDVEEIKLLSSGKSSVKTDDVLELVKVFASTWFSLDAYDKESFPKKGFTKKTVKVEAKELYADILKLKESLIEKGEATSFFGQERTKNGLEGIFGNVFQSAFQKDVYATVEEKAAHLLYFIVKDHPFVDGNKRSAAFSFIWFLKKAKVDFMETITPQVLATITLLIAESDSREKEKMIGFVILILKKK